MVSRPPRGEAFVFSCQRILPILSMCFLALAMPRTVIAVDFVHQVMPILSKHCGKCHAAGRKEGGLGMNTRGELLAGGESGKAVIPGKAAESLLLERVTSEEEGVAMPPEGPPVPAQEVAILKKWIDEGMPWEEGVTLGKPAWEPPLRPRQVTLPPPLAGRLHPIDRLLDAQLSQDNHPLPEPISDAAFLRRTFLAAIGLLPTPDQLEAFLADTSSNKREKLIDRLLADDVAYADHWLSFWNDLLRNDYTGTGFITGGRQQITTWLYAALKENKPYDRFVRELIAPTKESAGFIKGIKWRGEVNASQTREIQFAQNISQVFLGINMKCASCHDSFIDRWKLAEAYNLAAVYATTPLELHRCDKPTGTMATPQWIFPELGQIDPQASQQQRLQQLAQLMTHRDNGRLTRTIVNRIWHRLMGRGIVHPVDAMHTQPFNEDLLDYLAVRFAQDGYDLRRFIRFVMTSQAYQSQTAISPAAPGDDYRYTGPLAQRMTAEQLVDAIWQMTKTHPNQPAAKVDRSLRPPSDSDSGQSNQDGSTKLLNSVPVQAKWIWFPGPLISKTELRKTFSLNHVPTAARLMATCDNAFVLKINGTQVATSKDWTKPVYRDIAQFLVKGDNLIEVEAEMFGGAAGFICQLTLVEEGNRQVIATDDTWQARKAGGRWLGAAELKAHGAGPWGSLLDPKGRSTNVRASLPVRAALVKNDFLMRSLGRPNRDQVVTTRPAELTTLQAIDLSNGEILAGYFQRGAKNVVSQKRSSQELILWLYRFALSREPTPQELAVLLEVVGDGRDPRAVEDLLWMVLMLPEFQIIR